MRAGRTLMGVDVEDRELARLEHENLVALFALVADRRGGIARVGDGVAMVVARVPLRLFNFVVAVASPVDPPVFRDAIEAIRGEREEWIAYVRRGVDEELRDVAIAAGLVPEGDPMPGMAVSPIPVTDGASPELEIRLATDASDLDAHITVVAEGFGMDEGLVRTFLDAGWLDVEGMAIHVGWVDGRPVTTSLGFRHGRTLGIYNVATIESHRRRGYGAAMTRAAMAAGVAEGCDTAILQASEMGRPVYEALGFRTVVLYDGYIEPESEDAPAHG